MLRVQNPSQKSSASSSKMAQWPRNRLLDFPVLFLKQLKLHSDPTITILPSKFETDLDNPLLTLSNYVALGAIQVRTQMSTAVVNNPSLKTSADVWDGMVRELKLPRHP